MPRLATPVTCLALTLAASGLFAAPNDAKSFSIAGAKYGVLPVKLGDQYDLRLTVRPVLAAATATAAPAGKPAPKAKPTPAPLPLNLLFSVRDAKNYYKLTLTPTSYLLAKTVDGKASVLAKGQPKPRLAVPYALVVKRRSDLLIAVAGDQVLAECTDDTFAGGRAALDVTRGVPKLTGLQAQTVAPIHVSDDFMVAVDAEAARESVQDRTAVIPSVDLSALSGWDKVSGEWRLFSVLEEVREVEDELLQERIAISDRNAVKG